MKSSVKAQKAPIGKRLVKFWPLYVMLVPCIIYYILIKYVPMAGLLLAFKDYSYKKGIFLKFTDYFSIIYCNFKQ